MHAIHILAASPYIYFFIIYYSHHNTSLTPQNFSLHLQIFTQATLFFIENLIFPLQFQ